MPAIIRWPEHIKPGWVSQEPVLTMDIFPTLLDIAKVKNSGSVDGVSISEHLLYQKHLISRILVWQHADQYAVRKGKWKLVVPGVNVKAELYDLKSDFQEKKNVADDYQYIVKELLSELKTWKGEVNRGVKKIS